MKILRIILSVLLIACISFTFVFPAYSTNKILDKKEDFKEIITIWHIDTFEGGKWSRREFLNYVSKKFERKNVGVLIMVKSATKTGIEEALKKGELPDAISYGAGLNLINLVEINSSYNFNPGKVEKKQYALPWCKGGYVLLYQEQKNIEKGIEKLVVSQTEYTQPLLAFLSEQLSSKEIMALPPLEAYIQFVTGKVDCLLGTQRDVERLQAKGYGYKAKPLEEFNDLYQYISITEKGASKKFLQNFLDYLFSEEIQKELNKISMFSEFYDVSYENSTLSEMIKIRQANGLNVFVNGETLTELQQLSNRGIKGDNDSIIKIKNLVVKS